MVESKNLNWTKEGHIIERDQFYDYELPEDAKLNFPEKTEEWHTYRRGYAVEIKNRVRHLWDELEIFLRDDAHFRIININKTEIIIQALANESFHNSYIMAKIFGRIIPYNSQISINIGHLVRNRENIPEITFNFSIWTNTNLYYEGSIKVRQ